MEDQPRKQSDQPRKQSIRAIPERPRPWPEPPPPRKKQHQQQRQRQQARTIPVVYYLSKNEFLDHPHFVEVPVSSADGLYLRDVINRLVLLRGKRMPGLYSWSCKRSYKNGFVWHDISEDDLVLPVNGNEYVLKGSEILDQTPPDRVHENADGVKSDSVKQSQPENQALMLQEPSSSSYSSIVSIQRAKSHPSLPSPTSQADKFSYVPCPAGSSGNSSPESGASPHRTLETGSLSLVDYRICKQSAAVDASTQTEDDGGRMLQKCGHSAPRIGVSTNEILELEFPENYLKQDRALKEAHNIAKKGISPSLVSSTPSSSCGRTNTLASLMRDEVKKINKYPVLEEEEPRAKLKAANLVMQLISCGAIYVKDYSSFGIIPTYKPSFCQEDKPQPIYNTSLVLEEFGNLAEASNFTGLKLDGKECSSGGLLEIINHKEQVGKGVCHLQCSFSCNKNRNYKSQDLKEGKDMLAYSPYWKSRAHNSSAASLKEPRNESLMSPVSNAQKNSPAASGCGQLRCPNSLHRGSNMLHDSSPVKGSSIRLGSFQKGKDKAITIEESLLQEREL